MPISVTALPCLSDNYAWLLQSPDGRVAICDPGEAAAAIAAIDALGKGLDLILLTHHHADHVDGVAALVERYGAKVLGAKADQHRLPRLDIVVEPGRTVEVLGEPMQVLASDGHTRGHVAFHFPQSAFVLCGDTLFSLGCGRLLEGTAAEMFDSLKALAALPLQTLVCCGHEYTQSNARFALTVETDNAALKARAKEVDDLRAAGKATVPSTIGQELATNPFLRAKDVETLARIRKAKDVF